MSKYYHGYGNLVIIRHENGLETFYAHLSKRLVKVGDWVDAGTVIGLGGSTGRATGAHLHFETRYKGYAFDPQWIIDFESGDLRHRVFTLNRRYLSTSSRYVPESDDEEIAIAKGDSTDKAEAIAQADSAAKAKAAAEAAKAQYYTIRKGDSLYNIARSFHTSVTRICALNSGLTSRTTLKIGRRIRVK
jgi:pyruvate/2-oxoglutarate dehydrogenase complex dihydrolipoamide acyltransferase (E2) component